MEKSSRQKIKREMLELTAVRNQMDLKDIFRKYIKDISKTHNNIPSSHHLLEGFPKSTTFNNASLNKYKKLK